jgi:uncharacterized protein YndB with AHSA1/START domain
MKILQWALAVVGAIALAAVVAGLFLPSTFAVQRSIDIAAPADRIYDDIVEPRKWAEWTVWSRRDPQMHIVYSGPPFGMGARWSWDSKSEGSGTMEITRVDPGKRVEYALFFPAFNLRSTGELSIAPAGGHARVTWTNKGDVGGNPLKHYLAAAMDRMVGPDFEQGLANLKTLAEKS